jgi:putative FmdB family regulatory protein
MAGYLYECRDCGVFEVQRPIGTADPTSPCATCGAPAVRRYTAPMLGRAPDAVTRARAQEEASRDAPAVTTSVPPAISRPTPRDPRWSSLPRP